MEWERLEFKAGWNPLPVPHPICAFANDLNNWGGGYIVIGIAEKKGRPVLPPAGVPAGEVDRIQKELLNLCHLLRPHYFPVVMPVVVKRKHSVVVWVPGGQHRPYRAPDTLGQHPSYHYYVRRLSSTVRARNGSERELLSLAATVPFDDRINHHATLTDLQVGLIRDYLQQVGSDLFAPAARMPLARLARQMHIADGPGEDFHPLNVGLMFFNDHPERFFPYSRVEVVRFRGTPGDDEMSEAVFTGPIHRQIRETMRFIRSTLLIERVRKVPDRGEAQRFWNYPFIAIEEALVNALYHRGYDIREPVEVRIHPDHIDLVSYPGPDRSISLAEIARGRLVPRRYRNRRIGEFLKELELTEGKATGIPKIQKALKANGSPAPKFSTDDDRSFFLVTLRVHPDFLARPEPAAVAPEAAVIDSVVEIIRSQVRSQVKSQVREQVNAVLAYCREPRDRNEILNHIGVHPIYRNFRRRIGPLLKAGLLRLTVPDKPRSRNQRYVTGPPREMKTK